MTDESLVSQLRRTDHDTVGLQMLQTSVPWSNSITGVSTTELSASHLDETVYRIGITGDIDDQPPDQIELLLNDQAWLRVTDTPASVEYRIHIDGNEVQLHPHEVISGTQVISMELPQSTALVAVDSPGLSLDLVDSDYLDDPYYMVRLHGFVVGATGNSITLATADGQEFRLRARKQETAAIAHLSPDGTHKFEAVRALESGLIVPE